MVAIPSWSLLPADDLFRYMVLGGFALLVIGYFWMIVTAFRTRWPWGFGCFFLIVIPFFAIRYFSRAWKPSLVLAVGLLLAAIPPLYTRLVPLDLGPRDKMVDGERHITLTGWDQKDYSFLNSMPDVVVLQMANPDVTDKTLVFLESMSRLRELDLTGTAVTDAGLTSLGRLPKLETLRLRSTKITDKGFADFLNKSESLKMLDLSNTDVTKATTTPWKAAKSGRKVLH